MILNLGIRIISAAINSHFTSRGTRNLETMKTGTHVCPYTVETDVNVLINYTPYFTRNLKNTNVLNFVRTNHICFNKLLQLRWLREKRFLSSFFFREKRKLIWNLQFSFGRFKFSLTKYLIAIVINLNIMQSNHIRNNRSYN